MDINCDLGEGIGNDEQIMPFISSCNIACGVHAGSSATMRATVKLAKQNAVKIGAHPSFMDRENFGRKEMFVPKSVLKTHIINQIKSLKDIVESEGEQLHHVKPHGALYNMAAKFNDVAMAVIEAVDFFEEKLVLYVPYNSLIAHKARELQIPYFYEVFADRSYHDDLTLVSREESEAVITNPLKIKKRVQQMIDDRLIESVNGKKIGIRLDTICVHGDNPNIVEIVKKLSKFKMN